MPDWNVTLHLLTLALLGVVSYLLVPALKTIAEELTKGTIRDRTYQKELAREFQKSRGLERQELRFKAYGTLWKELRPLAIYDVARINKDGARKLFESLTGWYFSECGGLLLTPQARDFYFALQNLLRITSSLPDDWQADRFGELEGEAEPIFRRVLEARFPKQVTDKETTGDGKAVNFEEVMRDKNLLSFEKAIGVLDYFKNSRLEDWQNQPIGLGETWRETIKRLGGVCWS